MAERRRGGKQWSRSVADGCLRVRASVSEGEGGNCVLKHARLCRGSSVYHRC